MPILVPIFKIFFHNVLVLFSFLLVKFNREESGRPSWRIGRNIRFSVNQQVVKYTRDTFQDTVPNGANFF